MRRFMSDLSELMSAELTRFTWSLHGYDTNTANEIIEKCSQAGVRDAYELERLLVIGIRNEERA